jgi:hypothetical protein
MVVWTPGRLRRLVPLGFVLAAVLVWRTTHRGVREAPAPPAARSTAATSTAPLPELAWTVSERLPRDPFAMAPAPRRAVRRRRPDPVAVENRSEVAPPPPRVQILLLDPQRPLALLDNQRVAVGDTIAGYRVVAIDAAGVTLERRGMRFVVRP